jgi:hypothetical protein
VSFELDISSPIAWVVVRILAEQELICKKDENREGRVRRLIWWIKE